MPYRGDRWTLVFVRVLPHMPGKVWAALTDPVQLRAWAPFTADRDLGHVGDATLTMIDGDVSENSPASVTRTDRPSLLEYTWELTSCDGRWRPSDQAPG
jgi:uncharacterized protein YndB with AHSA1/START domain